MDFQIFNISDGFSILSAVTTFIALGCSSSFLVWGLVQGIKSIRDGFVLVVGDV